MPEPDFDHIARQVTDKTGVGRLEEWDSGDPGRVVAAIAEQLRQVWNARGAADLDAINAPVIGARMDIEETILSLDR